MPKTTEPLYLRGWSAKRAGAAITITHETGKVTNIQVIKIGSDGSVSARAADGKLYILVTR